MHVHTKREKEKWRRGGGGGRGRGEGDEENVGIDKPIIDRDISFGMYGEDPTYLDEL